MVLLIKTAARQLPNGITVFLQKQKKKICYGLVCLLALVLSAHLAISSSPLISTFPLLQLTWIPSPSPVACGDKSHAANTDGKSEQQSKRSSCIALKHKQVRWAYRTERELLQAASRATFNATAALMRERHDHDKQINRTAGNCSDADTAIRETSELFLPRIAFLFLVRGTMPHEPLWRKFFATSPREDLYSVYVHASPSFRFPRGSFFHCKHIPSLKVARFSINMVDAVRRLLAHALLDVSANNQRFVVVCEATIPIRSFPYTYNYLVHSNLSYVQAFKPPKEYLSWSTLPVFSSKYLKKGEMWMSVMRRHASMIVGDVAVYKKFKSKCRWEVGACTPDEEYIQTLLSLKDPSGMANKTIMYVDWRSHADTQKGSPSSFSKGHISAALIQRMKRMKQRLRPRKPREAVAAAPHAADLACHDPSEEASSVHCLDFSSVPYLFARKFSRDTTTALAALPPHVLGY